jgi:hypothetical protein
MTIATIFVSVFLGIHSSIGIHSLKLHSNDKSAQCKLCTLNPFHSLFPAGIQCLASALCPASPTSWSGLHSSLCVHMCVYYMRQCDYACVCVCVCVCVCMCVCVCVYVCMCVCVYVCVGVTIITTSINTLNCIRSLSATYSCACDPFD